MEEPQPSDLPQRALVVEDNMIIALDTQECLLDLGVAQVDVEATVAGALSMIEQHDFDLALLDCNLGSETSDLVAEELASRGVPFWLATGYRNLDEKTEQLGARGMLMKPFRPHELKKLLEEYAALK